MRFIEEIQYSESSVSCSVAQFFETGSFYLGRIDESLVDWLYLGLVSRAIGLIVAYRR